jgi:hypothetical protein
MLSVLCLRTELFRCFVLGPNWFGDTTAAPNIWQFIVFGAWSNDRTISVLWLRTELFRCFILGPNNFGALS